MYICCQFSENFLINISIIKTIKCHSYLNSDMILISDNEIAKNFVKDSFPYFFPLYCELNEYFKGKKIEFKQKTVFLKGTDFEKKVWLTLKEIPYGQTRTYKWLAEKIKKPDAARAVGQALKKNPLPLIFPCHRIISSDRSIGGYSAGVDIKKWLLNHEEKNMKK